MKALILHTRTINFDVDEQHSSQVETRWETSHARSSTQMCNLLNVWHAMAGGSEKKQEKIPFQYSTQKISADNRIVFNWISLVSFSDILSRLESSTSRRLSRSSQFSDRKLFSSRSFQFLSGFLIVHIIFIRNESVYFSFGVCLTRVKKGEQYVLRHAKNVRGLEERKKTEKLRTRESEIC